MGARHGRCTFRSEHHAIGSVLRRRDVRALAPSPAEGQRNARSRAATRHPRHAHRRHRSAHDHSLKATRGRPPTCSSSRNDENRRGGDQTATEPETRDHTRILPKERKEAGSAAGLFLQTSLPCSATERCARCECSSCRADGVPRTGRGDPAPGRSGRWWPPNPRGCSCCGSPLKRSRSSRCPRRLRHSPPSAVVEAELHRSGLEQTASRTCTH